MRFSLGRDAGGRPHLELHDAPPSVTALEPAPPEREPMLDDGVWLVMLVPTWSAPDIEAIPQIEGLARRFGDSVRFGIRPFEDIDELGSWVSNIDWGPTPIWIAFRDGKVRGVRRGLLDDQELTKAVEDMLFSGE